MPAPAVDPDRVVPQSAQGAAGDQAQRQHGGRGKRGGVRTLVATRRASRWFFVFGFEKNETANVTSTELEALQWLAKQLLDLSVAQMEVAVQDGSLQEICHEH